MSEFSKHLHTSVKDPEKDSSSNVQKQEGCIPVNSAAQPSALEILGGTSQSTGVAGAEITTNTGRCCPESSERVFRCAGTQSQGPVSNYQ